MSTNANGVGPSFGDGAFDEFQAFLSLKGGIELESFPVNERFGIVAKQLGGGPVQGCGRGRRLLAQNLAIVFVNRGLVVDDQNAVGAIRGSCHDLRRFEGEFENERGASSGTFAVGEQRAAQLLRGVGTTVQAKAVSRFLGRKAVREDLRQAYRAECQRRYR